MVYYVGINIYAFVTATFPNSSRYCTFLQMCFPELKVYIVIVFCKQA